MHGELLLAVAESGDPVRLQWISLIVGTVLPVAVGVVTKSTTSAGLKAILLAAFSCASGFLSEWGEAGDGFMWSTALFTWGATFVTAVAMHFGVWKPTGVAAKAQEVGNR